MQPKAELVSLQQLRCFCAAVESGSFTAAAASLRITQPAVAEQVRKLEHALGADLFVRAGRGVVLTEAGRAFAGHATRSLRAVEDAAAGTDEEVGSERALELADLLGHRGLCDPQGRCCGGERPQLDRGAEAADLLE